MNSTNRFYAASGIALLTAWGAVGLADAAEADIQRGAKAFQQCIACHSTERGRHMTGPSLAGLFGRKAGTVETFLRYSDALARSGVVWNEQTLDAWLADSQQLVPGNEMSFPGIKDPRTRRGLVAFLMAVSEGKDVPGAQRAGPRSMPSLKKAGVDDIVKAIRHCGDTYFVTTETGKLHKIWEFNLRFKTDTADTGPNPGKPVLLGVGMRGDRAAVVFAKPSEISTFLREKCE